MCIRDRHQGDQLDEQNQIMLLKRKIQNRTCTLIRTKNKVHCEKAKVVLLEINLPGRNVTHMKEG